MGSVFAELRRQQHHNPAAHLFAETVQHIQAIPCSPSNSCEHQARPSPPHHSPHLEATQPAWSQARQTAARAATCLEECVTPLGKGPARNTQTW